MMKRIFFTIIFLLILSSVAFSQSSSSTAFRFRQGTNLPSTCAKADVFFRVSNTTFYGCTATNTWTAFSAGVGSGTVTNTGTLTSGKAILGNGGVDIFASKVTITDPATTATLTIINNKVFTVSNTLTLTGTDGSSVAFGTGGTVTYSTRAINTTSPITGGGDLSADRTLACATCGVTGSPLSQFAATTSAQFLGVISNETGTGLVVGNDTPTIITPSFTTGFTIAGAATSRKIIIGNGTNFVVSTETWAVPGTSGNVLTSDGTNWTSAAAVGGGITIGTSTITGGTDTKTLFNNAGVVGERTVTGTGNDVLSASPTLTGTIGAAALTLSSTLIQTSNSATAFDSGPNGSTNPVFRLINSTASQADGISITGLAAGSGVTLQALSSGAAAPINITPKGNANINLNIPSGSNGALQLASNVGFVNYASNVMALFAGVSATAAKIGFGSTGMKFLDATQFIKWYVGSGDFTGAADLGIGYNAAGVVEINNGTGGTLRDITLRASTLSSATAPITFSNAAYQSCIGLTTTAGGVLTCTVSSAKVKQDFNNFNNGLEAIRHIQPQTFIYRHNTIYFDGKVHLGVIAENLQEANSLLVSKIGNGMLQPEPMALHAIEIDAIKQLDKRLTTLEKKKEKEIQNGSDTQKPNRHRKSRP